jgi:hypothetical protein
MEEGESEGVTEKTAGVNRRDYEGCVVMGGGQNKEDVEGGVSPFAPFTAMPRRSMAALRFLLYTSSSHRRLARVQGAASRPGPPVPR